MSCPGFYRQISRNNIDISEFLSIFNEKLKTEKKLLFRHAALQIQIEPTKFTIEIYPDIFFYRYKRGLATCPQANLNQSGRDSRVFSFFFPTRPSDEYDSASSRKYSRPLCRKIACIGQ